MEFRYRQHIREELPPPQSLFAAGRQTAKANFLPPSDPPMWHRPLLLKYTAPATHQSSLAVGSST